MYIIKIEAVKNPKEIEFLTVLSPIEVGKEIGWGADEAEAYGVKKWKVCRCEEV